MIPALIAVRAVAARVPMWAWVALGCLVLAGVLYFKGRSDGKEACQDAQERAERRADERAKGVGARAGAKAEAATAVIAKETEESVDEVRTIVRTVRAECPAPVLPERVHDLGREAVERAQQALRPAED